MYQAVFLDAGNTLFHTPVVRRDRIVRAMVNHGCHADPEEIKAIMEQVRSEMWDSPLWPLSDRTREDRWWLEYYERLLDHLGEDVDLAGDLAEETLYVHHVQLFADVKAVLDALQGHVRLAVISNAFPSLSQALDILELTPYFDEVVNSSLVDAWKPSRRIYEIAVERLGVDPRKAVFVDDVEENVAAAEDLGFTGRLIDRFEQLGATPYERITDLYPVVKLVAGPQQ